MRTRVHLPVAVRKLLRQPDFSLAAILVLALGVGASTAVFSVIDQVLLRELPVAQADRLCSLVEFDQERQREWLVSWANFSDLRNRTRSFETLAASDSEIAVLSRVEEPLYLRGERISEGLLEMLDAAPVLGRPFLPEDHRPGASPVVLISENLWRRAFRGDIGILRRSIVLNEVPHQVVGVLPASFRGAALRTGLDFWSPLRPTVEAPEDRSARELSVIGRLLPSVSRQAAQSEMEALAADLAERYPGSNGGWSVRLADLHEDLTRFYRGDLLSLALAVGLLLMISCANLAGLLLVRASRQRSETAVRLALGAGRLHLAKASTVEALLLALPGGAAGALLAFWAMPAIVALNPSLRLLQEPALDWRSLAFALATSLGISLLCGLASAMIDRFGNLSRALKEGGLRSASPKSGKVRDLLVVSEVAISLVLLAGASSMIHTFLDLRYTETGFESADRTTIDLELKAARYQDAEARRRFQREFLDRLRRFPGIEGAEGVNAVPLSGVTTLGSVSVMETSAEKTRIHVRMVSPGYFSLLGIPLGGGRRFQDEDAAPGRCSAILNEAAVDAFFAAQADALGASLEVAVSNEDTSCQVVGAVGNVRLLGTDTRPRPMLYLPLERFPPFSLSAVVKTRADPQILARQVRAELSQIDPDLPLRQVTSLERVAADSLRLPRFRLWLMSAFSAIALLLTVAGIYGTLSYWAALRRRDIGVRMAMGAAPADVLWLVMGRGVRLAGLGALAGVLGAVLAAAWLSKTLYAVNPASPTVLVATVLALLAASVSAMLAPAVRAARMSPLEILRHG